MSSFDPYRDWLGVDASGGPPNLYRLLGLRDFESEPPVIAEALEEQTAKLQSRLNGPAAAVAGQLLAQLQRARETLLDPERRRAYDAELRGEGAPVSASPAAQPAAAAAFPLGHDASQAAAPPVAVAAPAAVSIPTAAAVGGIPMASVAMPGVPVAAGVPMAVPAGVAGGPAMAAGVPMATVAAPVAPGPAIAAMPVAPVAAGTPMAAPVTAGIPGTPGVLGGVPVRPSTGRVMLHRSARKSEQATMALILVSGAVLLLLVALGFAFKNELLVALGGKPAGGPPPGPPPETPQPAVPEPPRRLPPRPMFGPGSPTLVDPNTLPPEELSRMVGGSRANQLGSMQTLDPLPGMSPPPTPGGPPAMSAAETAATASPPAAPTAAAAGTGRPVAIPASTAPINPQSQSAVRRTLGVAQRFLGERNLDRANEQLDLASLEATHPALLVEIERMRGLVAAAREFWNAAREGAKSLQPGEEFEVEGRKVQIIESDGQKIEARVNNQGLTYQLDKLPGPMAIFLVQRSTAGDEARQKHLVGAFLLSEPKPDRARARQLLVEAAQLGADCQPLVELIDAAEPAAS